MLAFSIIGTDRVTELVQSACETKAVTNTVRALVAACRALGISKLAILTPYTEAVSESLRTALSEHCIDTSAGTNLTMARDTRITMCPKASGSRRGF
jgi:maleate isomerase